MFGSARLAQSGTSVFTDISYVGAAYKSPPNNYASYTQYEDTPYNQNYPIDGDFGIFFQYDQVLNGAAPALPTPTGYTPVGGTISSSYTATSSTYNVSMNLYTQKFTGGSDKRYVTNLIEGVDAGGFIIRPNGRYSGVQIYDIKTSFKRYGESTSTQIIEAAGVEGPLIAVAICRQFFPDPTNMYRPPFNPETYIKIYNEGQTGENLTLTIPAIPPSTPDETSFAYTCYMKFVK